MGVTEASNSSKIERERERETPPGCLRCAGCAGGRRSALLSSVLFCWVAALMPARHAVGGPRKGQGGCKGWHKAVNLFGVECVEYLWFCIGFVHVMRLLQLQLNNWRPPFEKIIIIQRQEIKEPLGKINPSENTTSWMMSNTLLYIKNHLWNWSPKQNVLMSFGLWPLGFS